MHYSDAFRAKMIQRMLGPNKKCPHALAKEVGVHQSTLSRWLQDGRILDGKMPKKIKRQTQRWTSSEKLRMVVAAGQLEDDELGAFLRREGVHEHLLEQWRTAMLAALDADGAKRLAPSPLAKELAAVQRDLHRKDKALAEVSALLVLKKKADAIWGVVDDEPDSRTGK